jgi:predicted HicB family RNase H-like nuclease
VKVKMQFEETITIKIKSEEYKILSEYATKKMSSINDIVEDVIEKFVNQNNDRELHQK